MQSGATIKQATQVMISPKSCTDFKQIRCILESMSVTSNETHIAEGINTEEISNNDLFARKLSGRTDLDLFCITIL